ncbi:MAG: rplS [Chlamydiales bacterium]|jgi:large subunit ribosomal protein L19|nr:rplS [Chlamydiales bacterium]
MDYSAIIKEFESTQLRTDIPEFRVGDTVQVYIQIIEGDKKRTQMFAGTVIARKGKGISESFVVHRVSYGEGMERVFKIHNPVISKIEVVRRGKVRRAKLYYLRGKQGKASKVKEDIKARK